MTVRANKPAFNIREKLKELERPIGLKGSELMKSETAQDARDLVSAGRKNIIYNGSALINQRGANGSISSGTANIATDRWLLEVASAGTWDLYQAADGPPGFGFCHKIDCTAANASLSSGSVIIFQQRLEGLDLQQLAKGTASAKNLTLSFYVKSSKIGKYIVEFQDANNGRICQRSYNINSANVWEYKTITIPGDTSGVLTNSNGHSFTVRFWLAAGSLFQSGTLQTEWGSTVNADRVVGQVNLADSNTAEWNVTGVQLEVGKNATDFEHRSYGEELALCQRYFFKSLATRQSILYKGPLWESNWYAFPVEMRANPTLAGGSWFLRNPGSNSNLSYTGFLNTMYRTGFYISSTTTQNPNLQCWFNDAPLTASAEL